MSFLNATWKKLIDSVDKLSPSVWSFDRRAKSGISVSIEF